MIKVVAAYIRDSEGRFLVMKRSAGEWAGMWEFPGGKIEDNENENDAIIREIKEELSLDVTPGKTVGVFIHKYPDREIELELVECEKNYPMQEIVSDGSHTEWKWVGLAEALKLVFVPLDIKILEFLKTYKGGEK